MQDSWGDGWNSARIDATMNGLFVGSYECFGSSTIDSVYSFSGAQMDFTFYSGAFDNEITFSITDPQGNVLYNGPAPGNLDNILHTSNSSCPPQSPCVNPISWTTDNTLSKKQNHLGILFRNHKIQYPNSITAYNHNSVVWIKKIQIPFEFFYRKKNYHFADYNLFWMNIRHNLRKRLNENGYN